MVVANNEINDNKNTRQTLAISPNGVHPWLHAKPLDAAIRQVPALYWPGGCHSGQF